MWASARLQIGDPIDMGIRYYAYPVRTSDVELARANPHDFLATDLLADAWGPAELKPRMLYLDKCWGQLQELLGPRPDRPSASHTS
jgi:hypothetical protein